MNNRKIIIIAIVIFLVIFFVYLFSIFNQGNKVVKFETSYYLMNNYLIKSESKLEKNITPCFFSSLTLKNGTELSCKPLTEFCNSNIPQDKSLINDRTACAIFTFDINGFKKTPNQISSNSKISDHYLVFRYKDGIATSLNSIENEIMYGKSRTFNNKIIAILLFFEVNKYPELFLNR